MAQIKYRLPLFGEQTLPLRAESASVFEWMDTTIELRRLKNMDQLGVLKRKFSCAHHSKFEYVCMMLYLIEMCSQELKDVFSISREIRISKNKTISSITELLKCWAILLPIGHLHGTFANERAVLKRILMDEKSKKDFLGKFHRYDPALIKAITEILNDENYYKFYQCLAVLKLIDYKKRKRKSKILVSKINRSIDYVTVYLVPDKDVLIKAKRIFHQLRQIAYVLLDSHYCNMLFTFDKNILKETIKMSLKQSKDETYVTNLWKSLDTYLVQELYRNTESIFIENLSYRSLIMKPTKDKTLLGHISGQLYDCDSNFVDKTLADYLRLNKIDLTTEHGFCKELKLSISNMKLFDIERKLDIVRKEINTERCAYVNFDVSKSPAGKGNDIHIFLNSKAWKLVGIRGKLISFLFVILLRFSIVNQKDLDRFSPEKLKEFLGLLNIDTSPLTFLNWQELLAFLLKIIFKDKYVFKNRAIVSKLDYALLWSHKLDLEFLGKSKNQELSDLFESVKKTDALNKGQPQSINNIIIFPFNIKIVDKQNKQEIGDIDSMYINFISHNQIQIYMLQSKALKQSSGDAFLQAKTIKGAIRTQFIKRNKTSIEKLNSTGKSVVFHLMLN